MNEHQAENGGAERGLEVAPGVHMPEALLTFTYTTSRGPGGQNVNRRSTRARLRVRVSDIPISAGARPRLANLASHLVTEDGDLIVAMDDERSRERNRRACFVRLRQLIVEAQVVPKPRRKTRPTRASNERRLDAKKRKGDRKKGRGDWEGGG